MIEKPHTMSGIPFDQSTYSVRCLVKYVITLIAQTHLTVSANVTGDVSTNYV